MIVIPDTLTFDIETVPISEPLTEALQEEFDKRFQSVLKKKFPEGGATEEDLNNIRGLVMSVSPFLGKIVCISLYRNDGRTEEEISLIGDEKEILVKFWSILENFKGLFISFNGLEFDVPFIVKRSMKYGIKPTNNDFIDLKRFSRWPHFDVKMVVGDFDRFASGTLKLICEHVGVPSPKEGSVRGDQVEQAYLEGRIQEIADYCLRDVKATFGVYEVVKDYTFNPKYKPV